MEEDRRLPGWVLPLAGTVGVVVLVVIGLARGPAEFGPSTPEGTIQLYIDALVDGDFVTAAAFWADDGCIPVSTVPSRGAPDISASLVSVEGNDIEANVVIRITESSQDPLGGLVEYDEWFNMIRRDSSWKIRQPSWPYYDIACEEAA